MVQFNSTSAGCTVDSDCNGRGTCDTKKICNCDKAYVGTKCEFENPCITNPCENGGVCVPVAEDGSYYCDCSIGYTEPHCKERDPCVLEGNAACMNGATCRKEDDFEFECRCRLPYTGDFCESINLCEIDEEECIEDMNTEGSDKPFCHPCILEANCTQVSISQYLCSCDAGVNHSTCFIPSSYGTGDTIRTPTDDLVRNAARHSSSHNQWNPIIPSIAITSCSLYFLMFFVCLFLLWRRAKRPKKLIVCCDFHDFDNLTYYLISAETGRQWNAGSKSTVICFLCGENGLAGPYPLNDKNLNEANVMAWGQEDNYLVSYATDLGKLHKLVLWFDPCGTGSKSTWSCEQITVQNIKTKESWRFYASQWLKLQGTYEFRKVSPGSAQKRNATGSINFRHFKYQMSRFHTYISPIICITLERITLAFAEYMTYMLILICLYGFLVLPDPDIDHHSPYTWTAKVAEVGSLAAIWCWLISIYFELLFLLINHKRVPTLLVKHNMEATDTEIPVSVSRAITVAPTCKNMSTDTPEFVADTSRRKVRVPVRRTSSTHHDDDLFRIPSTDIMLSEDWVYESAKGTHGPEDLMTDNLVHGYTAESDQVGMPGTLLEYGFTGSLRGIRELQPDSFVYQFRSSENVKVESAIAGDIRRSYELQMGYEHHIPESAAETDEESLYDLIDVEIDDSDEENGYDNYGINYSGIDDNSKHNSDHLPEQHDEVHPPATLAAGDFKRGDSDEPPKNYEHKRQQPQAECKLYEIDSYPFGKILARISWAAAWIICLGVIITATVICCLYGGNYGYQRTYDWCISLAICWLESFLLYQFVKILLIVIIVAYFIDRENLSNVEAQKRFQVIYLEDGVDFQKKKYAPNIFSYLSKDWIPLPKIEVRKGLSKLPKV